MHDPEVIPVGRTTVGSSDPVPARRSAKTVTQDRRWAPPAGRERTKDRGELRMVERAERAAEPKNDRQDTLKQPRIFCETARLGTMSAAARAVGVSQPAVSTQMHRLEQR